MLIHIGYPKTGTSWLQQRLLSLPETGLCLVDRSLTKQALVHPLPLRFRAEEARAVLAPEMARARELGLRPVISLERLAGYSSLGGYDAKEIADRLLASYPEAEILVVLREQSRLILSLYQNRVMHHRYLPSSLVDFMHPPRWQRGLNKLRPFEWSFFEFHFLLEHYQELFGRERVHVLLYEQFLENPRDYVEQILRLSSVEATAAVLRELPYEARTNESVSGATLLVRRRFNRLVGRRTASNPHVLVPISKQFGFRLQPFWFWLDRRLSGRWKSYFNERNRRLIQRLMGSRFCASNQRTAELTGLDLAAYGYDL